MPYKKTPNMTFTRVKVPANHLEWLTVELNAPSQADLLAGLVHFASTPAGRAAVRASGLVPQRKVPTPPADVTQEDLDALLASINPGFLLDDL